MRAAELVRPSGPNSGIHWPRLYDLLLAGVTGGRERAFREQVLTGIGVTAGERALDVGCGTGTQTIALHRRLQPGGSVVGVDISEKMLAAARRKAGRERLEIEFVRGTSTALPFPEASFDLVTMIMSIHMLEEPDRIAALRSALRVLKPGGRLAIVDFAGPATSRASWISRHGPHGRFDLGALAAPLSQVGFGAVAIRPIDWIDLQLLIGRK